MDLATKRMLTSKLSAVPVQLIEDYLLAAYRQEHKEKFQEVFFETYKYLGVPCNRLPFFDAYHVHEVRLRNIFLELYDTYISLYPRDPILIDELDCLLASPRFNVYKMVYETRIQNLAGV